MRQKKRLPRPTDIKLGTKVKQHKKYVMQSCEVPSRCDVCDEHEYVGIYLEGYFVCEDCCHKPAWKVLIGLKENK